MLVVFALLLMLAEVAVRRFFLRWQPAVRPKGSAGARWSWSDFFAPPRKPVAIQGRVEEAVSQSQAPPAPPEPKEPPPPPDVADALSAASERAKRRMK
jgi:hypothetical protein